MPNLRHWTEIAIAPDLGEIIAARLDELREQRGPAFTQANVSKRLGLSIWYLAHGRRITMLRPAQFWALAEELDFTPETMLEAAGYLDSKNATHRHLPKKKGGKVLQMRAKKRDPKSVQVRARATASAANERQAARR